MRNEWETVFRMKDEGQSKDEEQYLKIQKN